MGQWSSYRKLFSYYESIDSLFAQLENVKQQGTAQGIDMTSTSFTPSDIPSIYPSTDELVKYIENYQAFRDKIDSGGSFKKQRLKLSEDKRFLFSFSLASKGLIRVAEYFNEEIAQKYPLMFNSSGKEKDDKTMVAGVVNTDQVKSVRLANGKTKFFIQLEKEYPLRQQQKGTAKMLEIHPTATLMQTDDGMFYTEPSFYNDFSLVFSSTFKKSYIEMPKKGGSARAVDIYIPFDMVTSQLEKRILPALPLILATEYLTQAKIKVRLNITRPIVSTDLKGRMVSIIGFPIKDFSDPLDWNKLAILRGIYRSGKVATEINAFINNFNQGNFETTSLTRGRIGRKVDSGGAYAGVSLLYNNEQELQEEFGRYKNWFRQEVQEGRIKSKIVDKPLMITFSTEDLLSEPFNIANFENYPDAILKIQNKFFEILDSVDIFYNPKEGDVVKRILKRYEDNNLSSTSAKNYVQKLIGRMYKDYEPRSGQYASTPEELEKADEKYRMKTTKMAQAFKSLGV
jgi:hypothetical protein